jgi:ABC-type multidrug transport system fused ATPase/permease subunit
MGHGTILASALSMVLWTVLRITTSSNSCIGQRIVARLREATYGASLRQEVEFVERGEGDVISRLSVDTSIVGERWDPPALPSPDD